MKRIRRFIFSAAIVKSYRELGIPASELTEAQKALIPNSTPVDTTYSQWFERQPNSIKKEVLGSVRWNVYQNNNLDVMSFYSRDGRKLTLKQLQDKNVTISKEYMRYIN